MKTRTKRFLSDLGLNGLIFGLSSIAALVFGVFSFMEFIPPIRSEQLSSILIGSIGLLMASIVALNTVRKNEINEIKEALGISDSEILHSTREVEESLGLSATRAKRFILDTSLNRMIPDPLPIAFFSGFENAYRRTIYNRVKNQEVSFKRVEIIYHSEGLKWLIFRLLLHTGYNYHIRHYEPSNKPVPMLGFVSFDNKVFYLGGFHLKGAPTEETALVIREPNLAQLFSDYWDTFWSAAIPLNEGKQINWEELKRIGLRAGVSEQEFNNIRTELEKEASKERRRLGK